MNAYAYTGGLPQRPLTKVDEARRVLSLAESDIITSGYEYWVQRRAASGRSLPGRQHVDPVGMRSFLPHVVLIDVVRDGPHHRFRNRLNGSHVTQIFGRDGTGKYIEHTGFLHIFDDLYRRFSTVVDEKALVYGISPSPDRRLDFVDYEHLTLPLASDGQTVDMLFGVRCELPYSDQPRKTSDFVVPSIFQLEDTASAHALLK